MAKKTKTKTKRSDVFEAHRKAVLNLKPLKTGAAQRDQETSRLYKEATMTLAALDAHLDEKESTTRETV